MLSSTQSTIVRTPTKDASVADPAARLRVFGQEDHVRIYGWDMLDRLRTAGFVDVAVPDPCDEYSAAERVLGTA